MGKKIRILYVEDVPADAELILHEISRNGLDFTHTIVETKNDFVEALISIIPDIIISDYHLPQFDGLMALSLRNEIAPQTPFIIVTGTLDKEVVNSCMKAGADDCLLKSNLKGLVLSIKSAFAKREEALIRIQKEAVIKLKEAKVKRTRPLILRKYSDDFRRGIGNIKEYDLIEEKLTFLDMAMDSAGIGTWVFDLVNNKRYFDTKACHWFGFSTGQFKKTEEEFYNCIHPEDRGELALLLSFSEKERTDIETDFRVVWPDGSVKFLTARAKTIVDNKKIPIRLIGLVWDITYHRLFQITLQENLRKTNSIINNLNGAVFRCRYDAEMTMEYISEGVKELSGYPPWDFLLNHARSYTSLINKDDRDRVRKSVHDALTAMNPYTVEYRIRAEDGSSKWIWERGRGVYSGESVIALEGYLSDITDKKKAQEELENSLDQLHELTRYIEKVREEERIAISRELHDDLGQALTAVKIDLGTVRQNITDQNAVKRINKAYDLVSETIKTVQRLTAQLRPQIIDDLGLESAIEWYASEYSERTKIKIDLKFVPGLILSPEASLTVFRIIQEALTNIARHSKASAVKIEITRPGEIACFRVNDNGIGISEEQIKAKTSFGLISMRERAASLNGTFNIYRNIKGGSVLELIFPIINSNKK
jgi:two-component system, NarL family, sensor histidine kinase UhpB